MHSVARAGFVVIAAAWISACGPSAPTPPPPPPATFTDVYKEMFPLGTLGQCNYCHNRPPNDISNGKLDMGETQAAAYAALVGPSSVSAKCGATGKKLVEPGHPENSLLYLKLKPSPPCGDQMPQGGSPLTATQLEMVRSWIAAGARND